MLALLDVSDEPPGLLSRLTGGVAVRLTDVLRAPCAHITLAPAQNIGAVGRRLKAAVRTLRGCGADTVCFANDFPYVGFFLDNGYIEANADELFYALSDRAAARLSRDGASVYFYAPRMKDAAVRTLAALCRGCRLVMADVPGGTGQFLALRRSLGVSVVESPPAHMLMMAEIAFIFGVPRFKVALPDSCVVYATDADALAAVNAARYVAELDVALSEDVERMLPRGFPRAPLIAEALRRMTLCRDTLELRGFTISGRGVTPPGG